MGSRSERSRWGLDKVFLALSINGAVYTINAFRPTNRSRVLFLWSFFASWVTIELAWFHLVFQVVATTFFWRKGALRSRAGKAGLVISLVSWAGLAVVIRDALASRRHIAEALRHVPEAGPASDRLKVKVIRNVTFAEVDGRQLRLDVYLPAVPVTVDPDTGDPVSAQKRPVLMQIHGGGWTIGDKREQGLPLLFHLAARGWVGFNVNYRLSPKVAFPTHLQDLKRALVWIKEHAAEYGGDPDFVAVSGGSAGGHLTALMGLTAGEPEFQPGFEDADTSVQAAVPFYGVYDFTNRNGAWPPEVVPRFLEPVVMKKKLADDPEAFAAASPLDQVNAYAPPFFVVHGSLDTLAPVVDARDFVMRMQAVSKQPVYYLELKGAQHAFDVFPSIRTNQVIRGVHRFLSAVHQAYLEAGETPEPQQVAAAVADQLEPGALDAAPGEPAPSPDDAYDAVRR